MKSFMTKIFLANKKMWPIMFASTSAYGMFFPLLAAFTSIFVAVTLAKLIGDNIDVPVKDLTKHHNWKSAKILAKVTKLINVLYLLL